MMWVCRAGRKAMDYDLYMETSRIYVPWEGFDKDYKDISTLGEFRKIVADEKNVDNRTTISNWSGQLLQFVKGISVGDYVLIPGPQSHYYNLALVSSDYSYNKHDRYHHSRKIDMVELNIPRGIFNQSTQYSLGAYRTLFKVKNEEYILECIERWRSEKKR